MQDGQGGQNACTRFWCWLTRARARVLRRLRAGNAATQDRDWQARQLAPDGSCIRCGHPDGARHNCLELI